MGLGLGGWEGGDWGVSVGEARGPSWRGRIRGVEREGRGVSLNRPIVKGGGGCENRVVQLLNHTLGRLSNLTTLF